MRNCNFLWIAFCVFQSQMAFAEAPHTEISNGLITAKLYLPDAAQGYYRGSRFDWSGVVYELKYQGHDYFGQWFANYDPKIHDAICGPAEEFSEIGYDQAPVGGEFIRIGIGGLRKPEERRFERFGYYELANAGKRSVRKGKDGVTFTHQLKDVAGYSYVYEKKENTKTGAGVRITCDRPVSKIIFWSSATTQCPEPYIDIDIKPGETFSWTITYDFYTL